MHTDTTAAAGAPPPPPSSTSYVAVEGKGCKEYIHMDDVVRYGVESGTSLEDCADAVAGRHTRGRCGEVGGGGNEGQMLVVATKVKPRQPWENVRADAENEATVMTRALANYQALHAQPPWIRVPVWTLTRAPCLRWASTTPCRVTPPLGTSAGGLCVWPCVRGLARDTSWTGP